MEGKIDYKDFTPYTATLTFKNQPPKEITGVIYNEVDIKGNKRVWLSHIKKSDVTTDLIGYDIGPKGYAKEIEGGWLIDGDIKITNFKLI